MADKDRCERHTAIDDSVPVDGFPSQLRSPRIRDELENAHRSLRQPAADGWSAGIPALHPERCIPPMSMTAASCQPYRYMRMKKAKTMVKNAYSAATAAKQCLRTCEPVMSDMGSNLPKLVENRYCRCNHGNRNRLAECSQWLLIAVTVMIDTKDDRWKPLCHTEEGASDTNEVLNVACRGIQCDRIPFIQKTWPQHCFYTAVPERTHRI